MSSEPGLIIAPPIYADPAKDIPDAYQAPIEDVTGPQAGHDERYLALYAMESTPPIPGDMDGPKEYTWFATGEAYPTWQAAFGSLLSLSGIKCVKIVKITLPCYILPESQHK